MEQHEVLLKLLGREFIVKSSPERSEELHKAVKLLTARVNKLNQDIPNQGFNRILVLTALHFAVENLVLTDPKNDPHAEIKKKIEQLTLQINSALSHEPA